MPNPTELMQSFKASGMYQGVDHSINLNPVEVTASRSAFSPSSFSSLLGALGPVAGIVNNLINRAYQTEYNRQAQANFERQLQFNAEEAEKARQFNSVQSLVNQYKAAGLNPNLLTGQVGGSSASAQAGAGPEFAGYYADNPASDLAANIKAVSDMRNSQRLTDANVDLMEAKADEAKANAAESGRRDDDYYGSMTEQRRSQMKVFEEQVNDFRALARLHENQADLQRVLADTEKEFRDEQIKLWKSQGRLNHSDAHLNEWQYKLNEDVRKYIVAGYAWEWSAPYSLDYVDNNGMTHVLHGSPRDIEYRAALLNYMGLLNTTHMTDEQLDILKKTNRRFDVDKNGDLIIRSIGAVSDAAWTYGYLQKSHGVTETTSYPNARGGKTTVSHTRAHAGR